MSSITLRTIEPSIIYITIEPLDINICIDFKHMNPAASNMVLDYIISNFEYLSHCSDNDHGKWSMFINGSFSRVLQSVNVEVLKCGDDRNATRTRPKNNNNL